MLWFPASNLFFRDDRIETDGAVHLKRTSLERNELSAVKSLLLSVSYQKSVQIDRISGYSAFKSPRDIPLYALIGTWEILEQIDSPSKFEAVY